MKIYPTNSLLGIAEKNSAHTVVMSNKYFTPFRHLFCQRNIDGS